MDNTWKFVHAVFSVVQVLTSLHLVLNCCLSVGIFWVVKYMSAVLEEVSWNVGVSLFCIPGVVRGGNFALFLMVACSWGDNSKKKTHKKTQRSKPVVFDRWGDGERQEAVCEQMAAEYLFGMEGQGLWAHYQKVRHSSVNGTSPKLRGEMLCLRCSICGPVRRDLSWRFSIWTPYFLRQFQENPKERGWVWAGICNPRVSTGWTASRWALLVSGVWMASSSVKRKGDAAFWAASAAGRRSSHEFKQQQGKFRLGIKENFPLIRLMKH